MAGDNAAPTSTDVNSSSNNNNGVMNWATLFALSASSDIIQASSMHEIVTGEVVNELSVNDSSVQQLQPASESVPPPSSSLYTVDGNSNAHSISTRSTSVK